MVAAGACAPDAAQRPERAGDGFAFAVMGDTPYDPRAERLFPALASEIASADVAFVVHVGDVKGSSSPCTDSLLTTRIRELDALPHPVVFVPGDNDWTDCHRAQPGAAEPLERLSFLRSLAYAEPGRTLGARPMAVAVQAPEGGIGYPEHQRWSRDGVVFATLHVIGSRNGLAPFPGRTLHDDAEAEGRIAASVSWLRETFREAASSDASGVVVALQANPWTAPADTALTSGFESLLAALREEAERFGGPVLLIHGDSHTFRVDRPFWTEEIPDLPNLTRLETFGAPDVGWVLVRVEPSARDPFAFAPRRLLEP